MEIRETINGSVEHDQFLAFDGEKAGPNERIKLTKTVNPLINKNADLLVKALENKLRTDSNLRRSLTVNDKGEEEFDTLELPVNYCSYATWAFFKRDEESMRQSEI